MRFLGVLLATALVLVGCGSESSERASATSDARELLSATVNNLGSLQSATLDLKVDARPSSGAPLAVKLHGPFKVGAKGEAPTFSFAAELTSEGRTQTAGATWTGDSAYATLQGKTYEVPSLIAGQLTAGFEQALGKGGPLIGIDLQRWVPNPVNAGTADVGGVETVKLTGEADVKRVISDVNLLAGQLQTLQVPGMGGQAPKQIPSAAADHVEDLTVTVYTGAEDRGLRRLVVDGTVTGRQAEAADVLLDLTLTRVGESQDIAAPENARPFNELLSQFQTR